MDEIETKKSIQQVKTKISRVSFEDLRDILYHIVELIESSDERIAELQVEEDC